MNVDTDTQWAYLIGIRVGGIFCFQDIPITNVRFAGLLQQEEGLYPNTSRQPRRL